MSIRIKATCNACTSETTALVAAIPTPGRAIRVSVPCSVCGHRFADVEESIVMTELYSQKAFVV